MLEWWHYRNLTKYKIIIITKIRWMVFRRPLASTDTNWTGWWWQKVSLSVCTRLVLMSFRDWWVWHVWNQQRDSGHQKYSDKFHHIQSFQVKQCRDRGSGTHKAYARPFSWIPRTFDAILIIVTYHFEMEVSANLWLNKQILDQDDDSVTDGRAMMKQMVY